MSEVNLREALAYQQTIETGLTEQLKEVRAENRRLTVENEQLKLRAQELESAAASAYVLLDKNQTPFDLEAACLLLSGVTKLKTST